MFLLTACTSAAAGADRDPTPIPSPTLPPAQETPVELTPDEPVSSDEPIPVPPAEDDWQPQPGDEQLIRGEPEIETAEILTLESFPPQFVLHLTGWKATPCHQLRVTVAETDASNRIQVEVYTLEDPAAICIMVLKSFDVNVPLGSFASGEYTAWVNGEEVGAISAP